MRDLLRARVRPRPERSGARASAGTRSGPRLPRSAGANGNGDRAAIESELPDASVSTQSDLAEGVTGSLSTASNLIGTLGTWSMIG